MEQAITASDANQRFSEMLREVQNGTTYIVTSCGRPVAKVMPVDDLAEQARALRELHEFMASQPRGSLPGWRREDLYD